MKLGEIITKEGNIKINKDLKVFTLTVSNTGDRPVQVGSHYHFAEANEKLDFDRNIAYGITQSRQDADWFTHYHILHCDTFSRKKLQAFIEAHQWNRTTEIKKRGFPMEPDDIRKQLKFTDGDQAGVIILTRVNDEHVMILCKRA